MNTLRQEILQESTAGYLAKQDEFRESPEHYAEQAHQYHSGNTAVVGAEHTEALTIHDLMASDNERGVLERYPELSEDYAASDRGQIKGARGKRNLDHFLENGVGYEFDASQLDRVRSLVDPDQPLTATLMREKIIKLNGFDSRVNYAYHDVLDHMWFFDFARKHGLADKYADFFDPTGYPFDGFLFSKQSELMSGIGFNARLYTTQSEQRANSSIDTAVIADHLRSGVGESDARTHAAADRLEADPALADFTGFVIKGALSNILGQRRRYGAVKRLQTENGGDLTNTGEVVPLLDPRYVAFTADSVDLLDKHSAEYTGVQQKLNLMMEGALARFVHKEQAVGKIVLASELDLDGVSPAAIATLSSRADVSTNYYG